MNAFRLFLRLADVTLGALEAGTKVVDAAKKLVARVRPAPKSRGLTMKEVLQQQDQIRKATEHGSDRR